MQRWLIDKSNFGKKRFFKFKVSRDVDVAAAPALSDLMSSSSWVLPRIPNHCSSSFKVRVMNCHQGWQHYEWDGSLTQRILPSWPKINGRSPFVKKLQKWWMRSSQVSAFSNCQFVLLQRLTSHVPKFQTINSFKVRGCWKCCHLHECFPTKCHSTSILRSHSKCSGF